MVIDQAVLEKVEKALDEADIEHFAGEANGETALVRLNNIDVQLRAKRSYRLRWAVIILSSQTWRLQHQTG